MCHNFTHAIDELIPRVRIIALEIVVIALSAGPDNEVRAQDSGQVHAALECINAPAPYGRIGIDKGSQLISRVGM